MKHILIICLLCLAGCSHYKLKVGDAEAEIWVFAQDRKIKELTYDGENHTLTVNEWGSETSQVIQELAKRME